MRESLGKMMSDVEHMEKDILVYLEKEKVESTDDLAVFVKDVDLRLEEIQDRVRAIHSIGFIVNSELYKVRSTITKLKELKLKTGAR